MKTRDFELATFQDMADERFVQLHKAAERQHGTSTDAISVFVAMEGWFS